jgi:glucose/arabinose dehydrogenase
MHRSKSATRFLRIFILSCFSALSIACTGEGSTAPGGAGGAAGGGGEGGAGGLTQKTCTLNEDGPGPDGALDLEVEVVAEGLEVPWALAFLPNGDILVTERPGRLRLIREGEVLPAPVLEVEVAEVEVFLGFEGGLLGIALHPEFEENRLFYLYFTATQPDESVVNRIVRYALSEDGTMAAFDRLIIDGIPAGGHHQGGRILIGPDGLLYAGAGAWEPEQSQDLSNLAGKLLRMNLDGSIPADNPDPSSLVFLSGIRNTQGFDWWDDEHILLIDHGPSGLELDMPNLRGLDEFNVAKAGENLGWASIWGCTEAEGMVSPVMTWAKAVPPSGAVIYTGTAIPEWTGSFMIATLGSTTLSDGQHLHRIELSDDNPYVVETHEVYLREVYGRLRSPTMGLDGHLYLTTSNCEGRGDPAACPPEGDSILRIVGTK